MHITYARSSSLNTFEFCPQSYFITYNLGLTKFNPPNKKTTWGTIVHKVMEVLALCKLEFQKTCSDSIRISEPEIGEVSVSYVDFTKQSKLTDAEVDNVNKTRINKDIYNGEYFIKYGHVRFGRDFVNSLILRCYENYKHLHDNWEPTDFKIIVNMTWMALDHDNGRLDPRFLNIKCAEEHFDFKIDKPWANYKHVINGKETSGTFSIKGTIDLMIEEDSETLVVQDYKTGKRLDWNTDPPEEKTFEKLCKDKQLMLYFYAVNKMFPEYKKIKIRIFFIRSGGDFTIEFDKNKDLYILEKVLENHFKEVKATEIPTMVDETHKNMKCKYLCGYFKNKMPGSTQCVCDFIHNETVINGIDYVVDNYSDSSFNIGDYEEPGSK